MKFAYRRFDVSALAVAAFLIAAPSASAADNQEQIEKTLRAAVAANRATANSPTPREIPKGPSVPTGTVNAGPGPATYEPPQLPKPVSAMPRIPSASETRNYESPKLPSTGPSQGYQQPRLPQTIVVPGVIAEEGAGGGGGAKAADDQEAEGGRVASESKKETPAAAQKSASGQTAQKKPARKFWKWFSRDN